MSELVIPKDLQVLYGKARWGNATITYTHGHAPEPYNIPPTLLILIERIARAEAKVAALEAENGRLKAPVRLKEMKAQSWCLDDEFFKAAFNNIIAARAQQPSQAQDKEQG